MTGKTDRKAQLAQLEHLKAMGEKYYDEMYEAHSSSGAAGCYSDAKECYYDAIGLARRLLIRQENSGVVFPPISAKNA
jgi:hypothetical protein